MGPVVVLHMHQCGIRDRSVGEDGARLYGIVAEAEKAGFPVAFERHSLWGSVDVQSSHVAGNDRIAMDIAIFV